MKKPLLLSIICFILVSLSCLSAKEIVPDTPSGRQFKAWLEVFNTGSAELLTKFGQENYMEKVLARRSAAEFGEVEASIFGDLGKLTAFSAETPDANSIKVTACNKSRTRWVEISFPVSAEPPHKMGFVRILLISKPDAARIKRLPDAELVIDLDKFLQATTQEDEFSGSVLLAKEDKVIYSKAFGLADRESKISNTPDTKYCVGSLNKMMTSVAIAQLAQSGKLHFTDKVTDILPDRLKQKNADLITIEHLLTHSSGLGDVFTKEWKQKRDEIRNVNDWFQFFADDTLAFQPGAGFSYSNAGYVVLGTIIEKVSGMDYYTYIRENITRPLGMNDTEFYFKTDIVSDRAIGYMKGQTPAAPKQNNATTLPLRGFPAGGGYSTVSDLLKFANGLRDEKLLNSRYTDLVISKKIEPEPGFPGGYGYGFFDNRQDRIRSVGHSGGAEGVSAELSMFWFSGYIVVVLANLDQPAASVVSDYIRDRLLIGISLPDVRNSR